MTPDSNLPWLDKFKYSFKIFLIFAIFGYFWTESEWRYNPNENDGHAILNNEFKKSATPY